MKSILSPSTSSKFSLDWLDAAKALLMAAISQPLLVVLTSFAAGHFDINWTEQWHLAASAAAAYLIKNFFSSPVPSATTTTTTTTTPLTK